MIAAAVPEPAVISISPHKGRFYRCHTAECLGEYLGISVLAEQSHFSRFIVKFFEISVAGMATAASGFIIAHVTGFFMSQTPAPVQPASLQPAIVQPANVPPAAPAVVVAPSANLLDPQPSSGTSPMSASAAAPQAKAQPTDTAKDAAAPQRDSNAGSNNTGAVAPAKPVMNVARQSPAIAPSPAPSPAPSLEAQVRAALAKSAKTAPVVPAHPAPPPRQAELPPKPPVADAPRGPSDAGTAIVAATPRDADPAPQPLPQSTAAPIAPAAPIEIKSVPVVGEDAAAAQPPAAEPQASAQADTPSPGHDLISAIKRFPDYLRTDTGALPPDQAPRPPLPVGQ